MATVKFPSEMPSAADVGGNDKLMISKDGSGEAFQVTFNNVKEYLDITDIELDPVQGGSSSGSATVIPNGPSGQNRKMDASPGWYSVGGVPVEATSGHVWKWFWNGSSWSLVDMGELPVIPLTGKVEEGNEDGVTGGEVFDSFPNVFVESFNAPPHKVEESVGRTDSPSGTVTASTSNLYYNTVCTAKEDSVLKELSINIDSGNSIGIVIINHDNESSDYNPYSIIRDLGAHTVSPGVINTIVFDDEEEGVEVPKGARVAIRCLDSTVINRGSANYIPDCYIILARVSASNPQQKNPGGISYSVIFEYIAENPMKAELDDRYLGIDDVEYIHESVNYSISDLGNTEYPSLLVDEDTYIKIEEYGQSLSVGAETPYGITTQDVDGNFMFGSNVQNSSSSTLNPLINVEVEDLITPCTNVFSQLVRKFLNPNAQFIATSSGSGGKVILDLRKGTSSYNKFYNNIQRTVSSINDLNKKVVCPVIIFAQGESDYGSSDPLSAYNQASTYRGRLDFYKEQLIALKNEMQQDIMDAYDQTEKPLFFVHNPQGLWTGNRDKFVNMAQIEACKENADMILLGSPYFVPNYNRGHLSTNGYRWWGEMIGKSLYKTFIKGEKSEPISPKKFTINKTKIYIDFYVPKEPLRIDTHTVQPILDYGFELYVNDVRSDILSIKIIGSTTICIESNLDLDSVDKVQVNYGASGASNTYVSRGNICDSDRWTSKYSYVDDSDEVSSESNSITYRPLDDQGDNIFGEKYPMQNWLNIFSEIIKG